MINHNTPKVADCYLISLVNARYILTGNIIKQDSHRYKRLVEKYCPRGECVIRQDDLMRQLGITYKETISEWDLFRSRMVGGDWRHYLIHKPPIEVMISHPKYPRHSVLIADYDPFTDTVRVTNFDIETTTKGWMFREDFMTFVRAVPGARGKCFRPMRIGKRRKKKRGRLRVRKGA
jgi:hypothetical protein